MAVFVDNAAVPYRGKARYHLMADTLAELHAFAQTAGIKRCWFHNTRGHPHYDITSEQRSAALELGAQAVTTKALVRQFRNSGAFAPRR